MIPAFRSRFRLVTEDFCPIKKSPAQPWPDAHPGVLHSIRPPATNTRPTPQRSTAAPLRSSAVSGRFLKIDPFSGNAVDLIILPKQSLRWSMESTAPQNRPRELHPTAVIQGNRLTIAPRSGSFAFGCGRSSVERAIREIKRHAGPGMEPSNGGSTAHLAQHPISLCSGIFSCAHCNASRYCCATHAASTSSRAAIRSQCAHSPCS